MQEIQYLPLHFRPSIRISTRSKRFCSEFSKYYEYIEISYIRLVVQVRKLSKYDIAKVSLIYVEAKSFCIFYVLPNGR